MALPLSSPMSSRSLTFQLFLYHEHNICSASRTKSILYCLYYKNSKIFWEKRYIPPLQFVESAYFHSYNPGRTLVHEWQLQGLSITVLRLCPELFVDEFPYFLIGRMWCHCRMVYLPMSYLYGKRFVGPITSTIQSLRKELYTVPYHEIDWNKARNDCAKVGEKSSFFSPLSIIDLTFTFHTIVFFFSSFLELFFLLHLEISFSFLTFFYKLMYFSQEAQILQNSCCMQFNSYLYEYFKIFIRYITCPIAIPSIFLHGSALNCQ